MKHSIVAALMMCMLGCASTTTVSRSAGYIGLTQRQLAARLGLPLRVWQLPTYALGGPATLFWAYYEQTPRGVEERQFGFEGFPAKVVLIPDEFEPAHFLSLDRLSDSIAIGRYDAQHGR